MFKVTEELEKTLADIYARLEKLESPVIPPSTNNPYKIKGFADKATGGYSHEEIHATNIGEFLSAIGSNRPIRLGFSGVHHLDEKIRLHGIQNLTIIGGLNPPMFVRGNKSGDHTLVLRDCENIVLNNFRLGGGRGNGSDRDTVNIESCSLIGLKNLTILWGTDENIGIKYSSEVTIQDCIIAQGLLPHSEGSLVREYTDRINFLRCLFAHNYGRNPQISNLGQGIFDIRNCLMYNEGVGGLERGCLEFKKDAKYNVVGNVYIAGPDKKENRNHANACTAGLIYLKDNVVEGVDRWLREEDVSRLVTREFPVPQIPTVQTKNVYDFVLDNAGAFSRMSYIEDRVIESVRDRSGKILDSRPL